MRVLTLLIGVLLLTGCNKDPESIQSVGKEFQVGKLFTIDNCTVYRFSDGGRNVYFTNCQGQVSSSHQEGEYTKYDEVITNVGTDK